MFRVLLWFFVIYFIYKVIRSITIVRYNSTARPPMPPPYNPPGQQPGPDQRRAPTPGQSANTSPINNNLGSIQDAEFEELPPDPPKK